MTTEKYVIRIDPAGTPPVRPVGIDLLVYPTSAPEFTNDPVRLQGVNYVGRTVTSLHPKVMNFTTQALLTFEEKEALDMLVNWQTTNRGIYEVVLYYLWDTTNEFGVQTRPEVPGTTVDTSRGWNSYYPVLQGYLGADIRYVGTDGYLTDLTFLEGSIL